MFKIKTKRNQQENSQNQSEDQDDHAKSTSQSQASILSDVIFAAATLGIIGTLMWYGPQIKADSERTSINLATTQRALTDLCQKPNISTITACEMLRNEAERQGWRVYSNESIQTQNTTKGGEQMNRDWRITINSITIAILALALVIHLLTR